MVWALSGVSQTVVHTMLDGWGPEGFDMHLQRLQWMYTGRRNRLHTAATRHLTGLAEWTLPTAGMFIWFDLAKSGVVDACDIVDQLLDAGISMVPGGSFSARTDGSPCSCFRASFSLLTDDDNVERGMARLADLLKRIRKDAEYTPACSEGRGPVGLALSAASSDTAAIVDRKTREAAALEAQLAALRAEIGSLTAAQQGSAPKPHSDLHGSGK
jgi:hypothetical protein